MEYASWSVVFGEQPSAAKWQILGDNDAYFNSVLQSGWVNPDETWTYVSATSFSVPTDLTAKYTRGVKIRLKQGGAYKYFIIVSSTYSAPNTTVVVTDAQGGSTYTIANSTITDNNYSITVMPEGWPADAATIGYMTGDGWQDTGEQWSFNAADAPIYTVTTSGDKRTKYYAGQRVKLTHSATTKYFIIHAVSYSAPNTIITLYGGTDYTLSATTITNVFYSREYAPAGFPLDPEKWSIETNDTSQRTQGSASGNTWYNINSAQIVVPIGIWRARFSVSSLAITTGGTFVNVRNALSTANNSASDQKWIALQGTDDASAAISALSTNQQQGILNVASKTTYYLNTMSTVSGGTLTIRNENALSTLIIKITSAYI